jgi:hypothetical protein
MAFRHFGRFFLATHWTEHYENVRVRSSVFFLRRDGYELGRYVSQTFSCISLWFNAAPSFVTCFRGLAIQQI